MKLCDYVCGNCLNAVPIDKFWDEFNSNYKVGMASIEIHKPEDADVKYICGLDFYPFANKFTNLVLCAKRPSDYCSRHELKEEKKLPTFEDVKGILKTKESERKGDSDG